MNSSSFSNDEYTIAWICALPEELEAALFMLDERHEPPQTHDEYDENIYELGTIWRHKVVITCLPRGGLSPATRCVERFSRAFRKIRCWFMVGIGGGVPGGKVDIRLGDVVVSVPSDDSSGIIQFDKGKYGRDGFTRTGVLDSPRELLLNAVNHFGRCPQVKALLDIAKMLPALPKKASEQKGWLHQGMDNDVLYCCYSTGSRCTCDSENCDDKGRIARAPRENYNPKVFRGIIGSSNAVIKDAWTREQLREKHNILCVETEAAGLMESQKFLIVRGIADYADWHKNDDWQQYAALMAATYTRELLRVVPVVRSGVPLPRERIFTVPFGRNLGFVGRAKYIADVESGLALATPRDFCAKVALVGLGGIGKTHIAIEIAYRISNLAKGDHVSLPFHLDIFWINASTYDSFCLAYCKIADKGLKRIADRQLQQDTVEKALEAITEYLEAPESGKWLLIVDGADNPNIWSAKNADTNSLFSYLPRRNGSGSILFTTRNRKNAVDLAANGKVLEVEAMSQEEAVELFISRVTKHGPCAELSVENLELAPKAVETLCFLPLAICQAAAYIRSRAYSVKSYMLEYDDTEEDILVVLSEDFDDDGRSYAKGRNAIATTWFITFEFIKRHSPSAIRLLLQMACLDPSVEIIPDFLLPFPPMRGESDTETRFRFYGAFCLLEQFYLVTLHERTASGHSIGRGDIPFLKMFRNDHSMHRLVRLAARNWLKVSSSPSWGRNSADSDNFFLAVSQERPETVSSPLWSFFRMPSASGWLGTSRVPHVQRRTLLGTIESSPSQTPPLMEETYRLSLEVASHLKELISNNFTPFKTLCRCHGKILVLNITTHLAYLWVFLLEKYPQHPFAANPSALRHPFSDLPRFSGTSHAEARIYPSPASHILGFYLFESEDTYFSRDPAFSASRRLWPALGQIAYEYHSAIASLPADVLSRGVCVLAGVTSHEKLLFIGAMRAVILGPCRVEKMEVLDKALVIVDSSHARRLNPKSVWINRSSPTSPSDGAVVIRGPDNERSDWPGLGAVYIDCLF